ncbi:unnamed protein product, partial [Amoebophrya sp. A120]
QEQLQQSGSSKGGCSASGLEQSTIVKPEDLIPDEFDADEVPMNIWSAILQLHPGEAIKYLKIPKKCEDYEEFRGNDKRKKFAKVTPRQMRELQAVES